MHVGGLVAMSDELLDFDVDGEIIAVIRQHRANNATMAREIVTLRAEIKRLRGELSDALLANDEAASAARWNGDALRDAARNLSAAVNEYGDDMTAIKWRGVLKANMELNAVFMLRAAPDVTKSVTE